MKDFLNKDNNNINSQLDKDLENVNLASSPEEITNNKSKNCLSSFLLEKDDYFNEQSSNCDNDLNSNSDEDKEIYDKIITQKILAIKIKIIMKELFIIMKLMIILIEIIVIKTYIILCL